MKKSGTTTVKQVAASPIKQTMHPIKNFGMKMDKAATPKGQPKKK